MLSSFLFALLCSVQVLTQAWTPLSPQRNTLPSSSSLAAADTNKNAVDARYYSLFETPASTQATAPPITLNRYLQTIVQEQPELRDLQALYLAVQMACKTISSLVHRAGFVGTPTTTTTTNSHTNKRLDQLSSLILKNALHLTGTCHVMEPAVRVDTESPAQHQPGVLIATSISQSNKNNNKSSFVACLDPLDGSGNADASLCTGTIFGVFEKVHINSTTTNTGDDNNNQEEALIQSVLQPATKMRAAGYCLYSSSTVMVVAIGDSVQGFTLDPQTKEFLLTHPDITIPERGTVYSCNEGNSEGWDPAFRDYIKTIKTGQGQTKQKYAHRYVGSMVGDIHRTLLYGGIICYPRDNQDHPDGNLQLLYKSAPMAYVVEKAGGKAIYDAQQSLLQVTPERVHQKTPCFMGSADDIAELQEYLCRSEL